MSNAFSFRAPTAAILVAILSHCLISVAYGQVLVTDEFDGTGEINQATWRLPSGGDGAFFGQTEVKTDLSQDYPEVSNGVATLQLDTFNPSGNVSNPFLGAEIQTKRNFALGGGLRFEARVRLADAPAGLVGGIFLFDTQRLNESGVLVRDEIDHEILSSQPNSSFTNYWNDGTFFGADAAGDGATVFPDPNFDVNDFHDYRVDWLPNRIDWYVDDELVRTQTENVPDDPVQFRLNLWTPDAGFSQAFSPSLQPSFSAAQNETFRLEIDRVEITQLNTDRSENLLLDPSFEDASVPFLRLGVDPNVDESATGQWFAFNNVGFDTSLATTGDTSLQVFGPFTGGPNASGVFQNVDVNPGEQFEASVSAQTIIGDSIAGESNYTSIKIEFLDANGDVLPGLEPFLGENGKENIILEGRDSGIPEGEWVERQVNAVAPANADKARVTLLFVQLDNGGGSTLFDDVSLVRLTESASLLTCDFDGDGGCDATDLDALYAAFGPGSEFDMDGNGAVNADDITAWLEIASNPDNLALIDPNDTLVIGDIDLDGSVDSADLGRLLNNFGSTDGAGWIGGDLNGDEAVDSADLGNLLNQFGHASLAVVAVPEPVVPFWLPGVALIPAMSCRRRR